MALMPEHVTDAKGDGFRLRPATDGDVSALARLSHELGYPVSESRLAGRLCELAESDRDRVMVAVSEDGRILGWVHVFRRLLVESEPHGEIGGLVVTAAERGRGVGRALVAAAEQWAGSCGLTDLRVRSNVIRSNAHSFYEHLGFNEQKTQRVFVKTIHPPSGD